MNSQSETSKIDLSKQRKKLRDDIISAYPTIPEFKRMIRDELQENPDIVAGEGTLDVIVSKLIEWAIANSKEEQLIEVAFRGNYTNKELQKGRNTKILLKSVASSGITTLLVIILRLLGFFEGSELLFFDQIMRFRPPEPQDKRLLLVKITPEDIEFYAKKYPPKNGSSLSDEIVYELLSKLIKKSPRVIGIDIYRYALAEGKLTQLIRNNETDKRLVFICKFPDYTSNPDGGRHNPPPDVTPNKVGLSDLISDSDGVIRRQLIQMGTPTNEKNKNSTCRNPNPDDSMNSFSLQVAQKYLNPNIEFGFSILKPFDTILEPLEISQQGGYNLKNLDGYQIMLNYRYAYAADNANSRSISNIAPQFTVKQVLEGINESFVKDKIILIGTPSEGYDNSFLTPFSKAGPDNQMQGLFIQAQMVSQLVSAGLKERSLIKVCSLELEMLWILFWSLIGAILAHQLWYKKPLILIIAAVISLVSLCFICILLFRISSFWISLYPSAAVFLSTGIVVILLELRSLNKLKSQQTS